MVEGHRAYEGDIYGTVEQAATAGGADDGWYPQSGQVARQAAGRYSAIEGQHLSEGQATRGDAPAPDGDYLGHSHQQLHDMVNNDLDAGAVDACGQVANEMGNWLKDVHQQATKASQAEQASWQGKAADQAHGVVSANAGWADGAANASWLASNRYSQQAAAAQDAKNAMPPPSNFDQAAEMAKARQKIGNGGLLAGLHAQQEFVTKQAAAQESHEQAAQVLHTMDDTYHGTATTQPSFAPPPDMSGTGKGPDEHTNLSGFTPQPSEARTNGSYPGSGPGYSPTGLPISGSTGSGATGGGAVGGGDHGSPGPGGPGSSTASGPGRFPVTNPAAAANLPRSGIPGASISSVLAGGPIGGGGAGGDSTRGTGGRGGSPRSNFAGSRVSGGGYLPKDGAPKEGAGGRVGESEGKAPGKGTGAGNTGGKEGPIARGGQPAAAKSGAPGQPGGAAGGGKGKKEDEEHKRKFIQDEDPFKLTFTEGPDGQKIVPPVIGE